MSKTSKEWKINGFERVVEYKDPATQLHALIAIHNTRLGPALGGIRAYPYASLDQALTDVTRLAQGMSYKAAVAETGTGGGKSVILLQPGQKKTPQLLHAFADLVNQFEGQYICAVDYGIHQDDLSVVAQRTKYVVGFSNTSGDPSRFTSYGCFLGLQATAQYLWGSPSLQGKRIAVQGLGATGKWLLHWLFWEGAELFVNDIDPVKVQEAERDFAATYVEDILSVECDILAPCALGGVFHQNQIRQLRCQAIAGTANNQLLHPEDGKRIHERGILYAPDFVINAGGLINVCQEIRPEGYNAHQARQSVGVLFPLLSRIFNIAKEKKVPTQQIAQEIAEYHLDAGVGKRQVEPVFHTNP